MGLPTAGSTSTLGPVGTTVQALSIPNPSSNIPQRTPIGALLLAVSYEHRPPGHSPSTSPLPPGATSHAMDRRPRLGEGNTTEVPWRASLGKSDVGRLLLSSGPTVDD